MRRAAFDVTPDLIKELMHMPPTATIVAVATEQQGFHLMLKFLVDDPSLPEADEPHDVIPHVSVEQYQWNWNADVDA